MKTKGSDGAFNFEYHPGNVSDKEWKRIQKRAMKNNPALADTMGEESTKRRKSAAKQWKNRGSN
jgi:hypothetical protein